MSTVQQILTSVKLYRNTYTDAQIVDWMDKVQRQIYQDVPHEAAPYQFTTIDGYAFYALPSDCDPMGVKQVSIERTVGSEKYQTLRFVSIESNEQFSITSSIYSVQGNANLFINPVPTSTTEGKKVYIIYNKRPAALSSSTAGLLLTPDLNEDFHELIELGAKARVARERGEVIDKNNFEADFQELFKKYGKRYSKVYPEYPQVKDTMPRSNRRTHGRRSGRGSVVDLIPESLM